MRRRRDPRIGSIWDFFGEEGPLSVPDRPRISPKSPERESGHRPGWSEERKGLFEWTPPEEEVNPKIDRMVSGWVKENPHNMVDILTGMYGLAGRDSNLQERIRKALDGARDALEIYPQRKKTDEIGRRMEEFSASEANFRDFKDALLDVLPDLIRKERNRKANDKADALIYVGDQIYEL